MVIAGLTLAALRTSVHGWLSVTTTCPLHIAALHIAASRLNLSSPQSEPWTRRLGDQVHGQPRATNVELSGR